MLMIAPFQGLVVATALLKFKSSPEIPMVFELYMVYCQLLLQTAYFRDFHETVRFQKQQACYGHRIACLYAR